MKFGRKVFYLISYSLFSFNVMATTANVIPNEYIIKFKNNNTSTLNLQSLAKQFNFQFKRFIPNSSLAVIKLNSTSQIKNSALIQKLIQTEEVLIAEPNYIYTIKNIPNDTYFEKLWGMVNTGKNGVNNGGVAGIDIGAEKAWNIQIGNPNLVVGIIDTGINYNHIDLNENIWKNESELTGQKGIDDDANGYVDDIYGYDFINKDSDPIDDNGHGTHCAGIIGAKGNNAIGITGVAWQVKLMALKFVSSSGQGTLDAAIEALRYATLMGAKVVNNSWGNGIYSKILEETIQEANENGVVFIAAAGNSYSNNDEKPIYPANYNLPNVIAVGAIDNSGFPATFSNYGQKSVHLMAPGVEIYSTYPRGDGSASGYNFMSGTSMAAPHVSGIVALLLSNEPSLTPQEVRDRLINTSQPLRSLRYTSISKGYVSAFNALTNLQPPSDSNSSENWSRSLDLNISSAHPYLEKTDASWEIEVPGATKLGLYFEKFNVENKYDFVVLTNRNSDVLAELTGAMDDYWTTAIEGDYVQITLKTDATYNEYGFDLKKVSYKLKSDL